MLMVWWLIILLIAIICLYISFTSLKRNLIPPVISGASFIVAALTMDTLKVWGWLDNNFADHTFSVETETGGFFFKNFLFGIGFIILSNVFVEALGIFQDTKKDGQVKDPLRGGS